MANSHLPRLRPNSAAAALEDIPLAREDSPIGLPRNDPRVALGLLLQLVHDVEESAASIARPGGAAGLVVETGLAAGARVAAPGLARREDLARVDGDLGQVDALAVDGAEEVRGRAAGVERFRDGCRGACHGGGLCCRDYGVRCDGGVNRRGPSNMRGPDPGGCGCCRVSGNGDFRRGSGGDSAR